MLSVTLFVYGAVGNSPCVLQKTRPDMEVFVGTLVNATDAVPMLVLQDMVVGVIGSKVT